MIRARAEKTELGTGSRGRRGVNDTAFFMCIRRSVESYRENKKIVRSCGRGVTQPSAVLFEKSPP